MGELLLSMLAEILNSNHKTALVSFLLLAPPRAYSPRELSRRLRIPESSLAALLSQFEKLSMVSRFSKGNHRYYMVSQKHKLLAELRPYLTKHQRPYEDELFVAIRRLGKVRAAFLSGIFTGQPQLPVDILIVGKISLAKLDKFLHSAKKMIGQDLNYSVMTPEEFTLRRDTFDRFIKDIFDYPHLTVIDNIKSKKTNDNE
jgi:hypothetical protein